MAQLLTLGLFGLGNVGTGIYEILKQKNLPHIHLKSIVVKDPNKARLIPKSRLSFTPEAVLEDQEINVVLELIDDAEAAYEIVKQALTKKKHVVTANKKMLAHHLEKLIGIAQKNEVSLLYEASVCGSIPIIRTLEESFGQDQIEAVQAISNGTCNYVLTHLFQQPQPFNEVIAAAQKQGFAEADPTLDIDGWDSKFKLILSNYHAFGVLSTPDQIINLGIRHIQPEDIEFAKDKQMVIKLIGHTQLINNQIESFVIPQFIPQTEAISAINFENNAVQIQAEFAQQQLLQGKGAGSFPTASAVLADIQSLTKKYAYPYFKKNADTATLKNTKMLCIYVSSNEKEEVERIPFQIETITESQSKFHYKIGQISIESLKNLIENENIKAFIAVFPDKG